MVQAYAEHVAAELAQKPRDRHLLNRFAEAVRGQGSLAVSTGEVQHGDHPLLRASLRAYSKLFEQALQVCLVGTEACDAGPEYLRSAAQGYVGDPDPYTRASAF